MSRPAPDGAREIAPGLLVLHGNRLELLRDAVLDWLARTPLGPLEDEVFLVQSNGAAEWLKMAIARARGVCAATRVELPARFLWRAYRRMLGPEAVPVQSALDRPTLAWRLMRRLPARGDDPAFAPIARFLAAAGGGTAGIERRWQLAQRLADLYDQYQVYRADWLDAWEAGRDVLPLPGNLHGGVALPEDQRWQPVLWRDLLAELDDAQRRGIRPAVHRAFVARALAGGAPASPLPRRVVLFGTAHVPAQALEALAALRGTTQVLLAIPNPCRYHWADIVDGRELLRPAPARHAPRGGIALAEVPLAAMHAHAHPLLAAWGRQGRDFMRQLDAFDDVAATRQRFALPRLDLFDDAPGDTMLTQLQADIRDLVPPAEQPARTLAEDDRSIVFHVAHSAQREVEVLHDRLLDLLAHPPGGTPLAPRDIVVMVPDIEVFAPAVRAVFGQVPRDDPRFIPFEIADLKNRGTNPLVVALEWLLRAPAQRFRASEVRDLLEVPGVARRFGLGPEDLAPLAAWIEGAGVRWGLGADQRASLGLAACGDQNSWAFGLRRMLMGYAMGYDPGADLLAGEARDGPAAQADAAASASPDSPDSSESADSPDSPDSSDSPYAAIEPYDEIGGLDAARVGALADLLRVLDDWWRAGAGLASLATWGARGRALLDALVDPADERERLTLLALQQALADALAQADDASFESPVPLAVLREAWLAGVDAPGGGGRFLAGGVTFCTLMPLRAVPFEVVALLGMNDGDFPRAATRSDFDLMGLAGQDRPGDRSRRDDDRYLMLEALLSARRVLHVSWSGRSVRDNSEQPASVLVSQLREHLRTGWHTAGGGDAVDALTTVHPLQPFSRRYFEGGPLATWAAEWRAAHGGPRAAGTVPPRAPAAPSGEAPPALTVPRLVAFLKNPVRDFFRTQLAVDLRPEDPAADDDEPFALDGLETWQVVEALVAATADDDPRDDARLARRIASLRRAGSLPMAELGERLGQELVGAARPMRVALRAAHAAWPLAAAPLALRFTHDGAALDDWLDGLRAALPRPDGADAGPPVWIRISSSRILRKLAKGKSRQKEGGRTEAPRPEPRHMIEPWVRLLAAAACGHAVRAQLIGRDGVVTLDAPPQDLALPALRDLLEAWQAGQADPLPLPFGTACEWLSSPDGADDKAASRYEGGYQSRGELAFDGSLARAYPDYDALTADGRFAAWAPRLQAPLLAWLASQQAPAVRHPGVAAAEEDDDE